MFREASVFVPELIVLRWLRWSNGFVGVVEPDQSIVFYGLESCWRSGVVEPDQSIVFYGFQKSPAWGILSACFLLGMGSTHAGVRLFRNRSFVFYGFQRWREAFCLRVFCLAWARILLVFRSFRIWRWRDFERPSFGIHVSIRFFAWQRLDCCWRSGVSEPKLCFFLYGFQRWREEFCLRVFCLAWARILLVFRSFRIWRWRDFEQPSFGIHVSNGFFAWQRLDCCWRSGVSEPKLCFLCEAFCLRVFCLAWARILLVFWSFRLWRWRDFEQPSFAIHGVRVFRNRTKVFFI